MGEHKRKARSRGDAHGSERLHAPEWVVYVSTVVGLRVRANTGEDAAVRCQKIVYERLRTLDDNIHFGKVAVIAAEEDEQQKENIARAHAPWLVGEGEDKEEANDNERTLDRDNTTLLPTEASEPETDNKGDDGGYDAPETDYNLEQRLSSGPDGGKRGKGPRNRSVN